MLVTQCDFCRRTEKEVPYVTDAVLQLKGKDGTTLPKDWTIKELHMCEYCIAQLPGIRPGSPSDAESQQQPEGAPTL